MATSVGIRSSFQRRASIIAAYARWHCDGPAPQLSLLDAYEQAVLVREAARAGKQTALLLDERRIVRLPVLSAAVSTEPGSEGQRS